MGLFDFFKPKNITVQPSEVMPVRNYTNSNFDNGFELIVEDVFTITGRGTIVTGHVTRGMVRVGDEVIIWDNENITLEQLAEKCNTINYEILCTIGARVPRKFVKDDISKTDYTK